MYIFTVSELKCFCSFCFNLTRVAVKYTTYPAILSHVTIIGILIGIHPSSHTSNHSYRYLQCHSVSFSHIWLYTWLDSLDHHVTSCASDHAIVITNLRSWSRDFSLSYFFSSSSLKIEGDKWWRELKNTRKWFERYFCAGFLLCQQKFQTLRNLNMFAIFPWNYQRKPLLAFSSTWHVLQHGFEPIVL